MGTHAVSKADVAANRANSDVCCSCFPFDLQYSPSFRTSFNLDSSREMQLGGKSSNDVSALLGASEQVALPHLSFIKWRRDIESDAPDNFCLPARFWEVWTDEPPRGFPYTAMDTIVPWAELEALIAPYFPRASKRRQRRSRDHVAHQLSAAMVQPF